MNDLEICKRIAEIEGFVFEMSPQGDWGYVNEVYEEYNPLTDDALCFKLMVKYKVVPVYNNNAMTYFASIKNSFNGSLEGCATDDNPNKAICLAIIEAHNK